MMNTQTVLRHNLPTHPTPFIGRESEIEEIQKLLHDDDCQLLTLVGAGGIGKTRLAIEVAQQQVSASGFPDGVYFVPLQSLTHPNSLAPAIVDALGIIPHGDESPETQLLQYLRSKKLLLVLDNFEHLLDAIPLLTDIIHHASEVQLMVTSRQVLNLQEEWIRPVRGLLVPEKIDEPELVTYSAVQLFTERARRVQGNFLLRDEQSHVTRICQLVEGMPLALELVASWLKVLSCHEIAQEIEQGLDVLESNFRNLPERHRSISAIFASSWDMLTEKERYVFKRLAVFQDGFTRDSAKKVAGASLQNLSSLVDKSFIRLDSDRRYSIHELLRQYADEQLGRNRDEQEDAHARYAIYYADLLHRLESDLKGPGQVEAVTLLDTELENVMASIRWLILHNKEHELQNTLDSVTIYFEMRSRYQQAIEIFTLAVEHFSESNTTFRLHLLLLQGWFYFFSGKVEMVKIPFQKALPIFQATKLQGEMAMPLMLFTRTLTESIEYYDIQRIFESNLSIYQERADHWGIAWSLYSISWLAVLKGHHDETLQLMEEGLSNFHVIGDRWGSVWILGLMGIVFEEIGKYEESRQCYLEVLSINQDVRDITGKHWALFRLINIVYMLENGTQINHYIHEFFKLQSSFVSLFYVEILLARALQLFLRGNPYLATELATMAIPHYHEAKLPIAVAKLLTDLETSLSPDEFASARRSGDRVELEEIAESILQNVASTDNPEIHLIHSSNQPLIDPLSERELEVLSLIADGLTNQEIADRLYIVKGTVKAHVNAIYRKLDVRNRVEAVAKSQQLDLI